MRTNYRSTRALIDAISKIEPHPVVPEFSAIVFHGNRPNTCFYPCLRTFLRRAIESPRRGCSAFLSA